MRKPAAPRTRTLPHASARESEGLIGKAPDGRQSAGTESVLDNRSHRTTQVLAWSRVPNGLRRTRC
jgi:hypothetical protein